MHATPARECGDCALCCKLGEIPDFKPYNRWCTHCSTRARCDIYPTRPQPCRDFHCHYVLSDLPPHWAPMACGMVVDAKEGPPLRLTILVDPDRPPRWQEPLYLAQIQHWAMAGAVTLMVGDMAYAAYPDGIEPLGELTPAHTLVITEIETTNGLRYRIARQLRNER